MKQYYSKNITSYKLFAYLSSCLFIRQNSTYPYSPYQVRIKNISLSYFSSYFLSFLQYCVQSLSVHSEQRSAILLFSQNLSGYTNTHISQTSHTTRANITSDHEKKLFNDTIGRNIIKWSQLKILQVVQHLLCIMILNGHQMRTHIKSHT